MTTNEEMTKAVRGQLRQLVDQFGGAGLRVLGVAPDGTTSETFLHDESATTAVLVTFPIQTPTLNPIGAGSATAKCPHCHQTIRITF